jgi:hypothetical protein
LRIEVDDLRMDTLLAYSEVDDAFRTLRRGTGKVTK